MRNNFSVLEGFFLTILIVAVVALLIGAVFGLYGWLIMLLWNALMPEIFGLTTISFWQSVGLLLLSGFLLKSGGPVNAAATAYNNKKS